MSVPEEEALINYRLEQAKETANVVEFLIENSQLALAMNRIYYGMFYALLALSLSEKFRTAKHLQLIGWFNKNFIATSKCDAKFGQSLRKAYQNRTKGDYDAFVEFDIAEVKTMLIEMEAFNQEIIKLIK